MSILNADIVRWAGFTKYVIYRKRGAFDSAHSLWVAVADPYVGLARKRPKTKWRLQLAENELITYIFAVQDICSILATLGSCYEVSAYNGSTNSVYTHCCYGQDKMASRLEAKVQHQYIFAILRVFGDSNLLGLFVTFVRCQRDLRH